MVDLACFCPFLSSSSSSDPLVLWSDGSASARCSAGVGAEVGAGQRRAALLSLRGFLALGSGLSFLVLAFWLGRRIGIAGLSCFADEAAA